MRKFFLWVGLLSLVASGANAASYQMTDGGLVDPILTTTGAVHSYSGNNLAPGATLSHTTLSNANLTAADLASADLTFTYLNNADLTDANLTSANLTGADLKTAKLTNANLTDATLVGATLSQADLTGADLTGANLIDAPLWGATLTGATLTNVDLWGASYLGTTTGSAYYNAETDFTSAWSGDWENSPLFDPVAAGWTLVPEPSTGLLLGVGLAGLGMRRRRTH